MREKENRIYQTLSNFERLKEEGNRKAGHSYKVGEKELRRISRKEDKLLRKLQML